MRGRPSTNGTMNANAEPNRLEPIPDAPAWLSAAGRTKWDEIAPLLHRQGLLARIDVDAVAEYCATFAIWRKAVETLDREGITLEARKHPAAGIADAAVKTLLAIAREIGLTAVSRQRLNLSPPPKSGVAARDRSKGPPPPPWARTSEPDDNRV